MKLSVVLSVYNEEKNIKECLESVLDLADEIVVVDHESVDNTLEIARKYTKHVFTQKNDSLHIDQQKNFGFGKATGDWIVSLDADERVTPLLALEIKDVIANGESLASGYEIPRKNIIFGKWIEHSLWWPDYQLRLFQRGSGEYKDQTVHKQIHLDGTLGKLKEPLLHENYQSISQYLKKMDQYTENEAKALAEKNTHMFWTDAIRMPVRDFLKTFFFQLGYKDGLHGLVLSSLQAFYTFLVFAKVWEKQGFKEENNHDFLTSVYKEWMVLQKEIAYWFFSAFITLTKNPLQKVKLKLLRKKVSR